MIVNEWEMGKMNSKNYEWSDSLIEEKKGWWII